jgi:hypothetical protein
MIITSKSIDNEIKVFIGEVEIGTIIGTQGKYVLVEGESMWKIKYSLFN